MKQTVRSLCYGRWCVLPTRLQTVNCTWETVNNEKCNFFLWKEQMFSARAGLPECRCQNIKSCSANYVGL